MSGISTKTALVKSKIKNKKIKLLDTRKTIPGMRAEQKYATKVGGATNHRFDLSDGLMIKDNHIFATDGLNNNSNKKNFIRGKFLEIEVKKLSQLKQWQDRASLSSCSSSCFIALRWLRFQQK